MIGKPESGFLGFLGSLEADAAFELPGDARTHDFWDAWQFAAVESALALEAWTSARPDDKELGYCAYLACLDREEQAATALAEQVDPTAATRLRTNR